MSSSQKEQLSSETQSREAPPLVGGEDVTLYNAVKILEMKYEDKMEKLKEKMREKGERSYLSGCALIVYGRDRYYGIFSGVSYANLVAKRTARSTTKEIAKELEKILTEKA